MKRNRIEAFTDGVAAIIITIMVLELSPPETLSSSDIITFIGQLAIYAISFTYVGIYWMNHHHLFQTVTNVNGKVLIANLSLLFINSLLPIATAWISEDLNHGSAIFYGIVLFLSSIFYYILVRTLINNGNEITKKIYATHGIKKEIASTILYFTGMIVSLISPFVSLVIYFGVAFIWIIPDRRIEKEITEYCD